MIHVDLAPEPDTFDARVRQPGLSAISEMVGEKPTIRRPGPRRAKCAERREDIRADQFPPIWRDALGDLMAAYNRICAYTCFYIEPVIGAASVDHMIPKSAAWDRVYEWANYRLACSLMNSRKSDMSDVLDPFSVVTGWFVLELVGFQVVPARRLPQGIRPRVVATIERLRLNDWDCRELRRTYAEDYEAGHIDLDFLTRRAPFVAAELKRQGRLNPGDI